jgi:hypothetical protein
MPVVYASGFEDPQEMAFDSTGTLFVGHSRNASGLSIYKVPPGGGSFTEVGGNAFSDPDGLDVDSSGTVWISSGVWANVQDGEVKSLSPTNVVRNIGNNYLRNPTALQIDRTGRFGSRDALVVGNQRMTDFQILRVTTTGSVTTLHETTLFFVVTDLCFDSQETVWFLGEGHLFKWPSGGNPLELSIAGTTVPLRGLAFDPVKSTLVIGSASERRVFRVSLDGTIGEQLASGIDPRSLIVDRQGDVYASDESADVVWRISASRRARASSAWTLY